MTSKVHYKSSILLIILSAVVCTQAFSDITNETSRVLDGAGGAVSNESYRGHTAILQPNPVGFSSNEKFLNSAGFLHSDTLQPTSTADSDGDGISDWQEITGVLSDPLAPTHTQLADTDGDGVSDYQEIAAGTNPTDPSSLFEIMSAENVDDAVVVVWQARGGRSYRLWSADSIPDLQTNPTLVVQSTAMGGVGLWNSTVMIYSNDSTARRFYKVQTP
ncbi:MAG TPA: hypothetical protein PKE17_18965 [Saprospiraceae bacterium]|nr:hypothetical protein [Saprospiraceae bacterium]